MVFNQNVWADFGEGSTVPERGSGAPESLREGPGHQKGWETLVCGAQAGLCFTCILIICIPHQFFAVTYVGICLLSFHTTNITAQICFPCIVLAIYYNSGSRNVRFVNCKQSSTFLHMSLVLKTINWRLLELAWVGYPGIKWIFEYCQMGSH